MYSVGSCKSALRRSSPTARSGSRDQLRMLPKDLWALVTCTEHTGNQGAFAEGITGLSWYSPCLGLELQSLPPYSNACALHLGYMRPPWLSAAGPQATRSTRAWCCQLSFEGS